MQKSNNTRGVGISRVAERGLFTRTLNMCPRSEKIISCSAGPFRLLQPNEQNSAWFLYILIVSEMGQINKRIVTSSSSNNIWRCIVTVSGIVNFVNQYPPTAVILNIDQNSIDHVGGYW